RVVARRVEVAFAETQVRGDDVGAGERGVVHVLEAREDVRIEAAETRRGAAAALRVDDFGEHLNRHHLGALCDARPRLDARRVVPGRDPRDVRAVDAAVVERAGNGRARAD